MAFKKGDSAKLAIPVPEGKIASMRMDEDGVIYCLLQWVDEAGQTQQRWFEESKLIAI